MEEGFPSFNRVSIALCGAPFCTIDTWFLFSLLVQESKICASFPRLEHKGLGKITNCYTKIQDIIVDR